MRLVNHKVAQSQCQVWARLNLTPCSTLGTRYRRRRGTHTSTPMSQAQYLIYLKGCDLFHLTT
jgi:hypothetical protein